MSRQSTTDAFFLEQKQKSQIKSEIVSEFFSIYLPIIFNRFKDCDIYYIDLFSGPGNYEDGKKSTPMLILDKVEKFGQSNPKVFSLIHFYFNEIDKSYWKLLDESVKKHVVYSRLKYCPLITNQNAEDVDLSQIKSNRPVFSFVDPFGYASTSARQIWSITLVLIVFSSLMRTESQLILTSQIKSIIFISFLVTNFPA